MCGTGIGLEVEIYATKLANETSPWTPMHVGDVRTDEQTRKDTQTDSKVISLASFYLAK
jgi:hypothetical protein